MPLIFFGLKYIYQHISIVTQIILTINLWTRRIERIQKYMMAFLEYKLRKVFLKKDSKVTDLDQVEFKIFSKVNHFPLTMDELFYD